MRKGRKLLAILLTGVALSLLPAIALAGRGDLEVWPAYYEGQALRIMMGPGGNSANPNQPPSRCFHYGPNFAGTKRAADVPIMYAVMAPGATQMSCPDGALMHDMILTAAPGDRGYNAVLQPLICMPGPNFTQHKMPYTSAAAVESGIAAGELSCTLYQPIQFGQVVGAR